MSSNVFLPEYVERYVVSEITRETDAQKALREKTRRMPEHGMQIAPDEAAFLSLLVKITNAKRIVEIGTYTGYSAMAMAMALPDGGKITCCDINKEWTSIARRHWLEAGVADKIDLRLAPAADTLNELLKDGKAGSFDLAFIDADKKNYDIYYEACLKLVRTGGVIVFDNMLWGGDVARPNEHDEDTDALRAMNLKLRDDGRIDTCMLTIADGVVLARKKI